MPNIMIVRSEEEFRRHVRDYDGKSLRVSYDSSIVISERPLILEECYSENGLAIFGDGKASLTCVHDEGDVQCIDEVVEFFKAQGLEAASLQAVQVAGDPNIREKMSAKLREYGIASIVLPASQPHGDAKSILIVPTERQIIFYGRNQH